MIENIVILIGAVIGIWILFKLGTFFFMVGQAIWKTVSKAIEFEKAKNKIEKIPILDAHIPEKDTIDLDKILENTLKELKDDFEKRLREETEEEFEDDDLKPKSLRKMFEADLRNGKIKEIEVEEDEELERQVQRFKYIAKTGKEPTEKDIQEMTREEKKSSNLNNIFSDINETIDDAEIKYFKKGKKKLKDKREVLKFLISFGDTLKLNNGGDE